MNARFKLCLSAVALALLPAVAHAEASPTEWAKKRINDGLVRPLAHQEKERNSFSRAVLPPKERRVRVVQANLSHDTQGRAFMAYAIDVRYGENWETDVVGCVYKKTGNLYVQSGDEFRPAEYLLGKDVKAVSDVCVARSSNDRA